MTNPLNQESNVYVVFLKRNDKPFEDVFRASSEEAEAVKFYEEAMVEWKKAIEDKRPVTYAGIKNGPIVTSFSPNMLMEIRVDKMSPEEFDRLSNPYNAQMQDQGFSKFMQSNGSTQF